MSALAVYAEPGYVSIVMELVLPGSLKKVIEGLEARQIRFSEHEVAAVIKGIANGLEFLHR